MSRRREVAAAVGELITSLRSDERNLVSLTFQSRSAMEAARPHVTAKLSNEFDVTTFAHGKTWELLLKRKER